nr:hypothetical protein [Tanacetum cinerariifolium]
PSPAIESTSDDLQNKNTSDTKTEASPNTISPKPFIKVVKATDRPTKNKTDKVETAKKPAVKYAELYRKPSKGSKSPVIHQPPQELSIPEMEDLKQQYLDELKRLSNLEYLDEIKITELKENFNDQIEDFSEPNKEFSSIDDNSFSIENIDYVEASPSDSELVSSE